MKLIKYGHCCLLVQEKGVNILIDPGVYSTGFEGRKDIDVLIIADGHPDHFTVDGVKNIVANNPKIDVYAVGNARRDLEEVGIIANPFGHGTSVTIKDVLIEGFGEKHAVMHSSIPQSENTGVFVSNRFFYPADAFTDPGKPVEILALPVIGPWLKVSESIDYALEIKPRFCFPVHDGMTAHPGSGHRLPMTILPPRGIEWQVLELGKEYEF